MKEDIIGVKITPHFHNSRENKRVIHESDQVFISEELDNNSNKDSSLKVLNINILLSVLVSLLGLKKLKGLRRRLEKMASLPITLTIIAIRHGR